MQVKALITGVVFLFNCSSLYADYDVTGLQKLFTDKNQREQIDASRKGELQKSENKKSSQVTLSGYVKRSEGKSVVWVNNKNTLNQKTVDDIRVHEADIGKNNDVGLTVDGKYIKLKPGETWYKDTGKVVDAR